MSSASSVPPELKSAVFREARSKLGDEAFEQLLAGIGEDGIVQAMLKAEPEPAVDDASAGGWLGNGLAWMSRMVWICVVISAGGAIWDRIAPHAWWHWVFLLPLEIALGLAVLWLLAHLPRGFHLFVGVLLSVLTVAGLVILLVQ